MSLISFIKSLKGKKGKSDSQKTTQDNSVEQSPEMVARENFSRSIKANVNPNEAIAKANSKATSTEDTSSESEGEEAAAANEGPDIGERGNSPRIAKVKKESLDKAKSKDSAKSAPSQPAVNPILNNTVQTSLDSSSSEVTESESAPVSEKGDGKSQGGQGKSGNQGAAAPGQGTQGKSGGPGTNGGHGRGGIER